MITRAQDVVRRRRRQRGQTSIIVVTVISLFLLGFIGFAVDFSNLWFHRQMAQAAADAACQAGGMNMLTVASVSGTSGSFNPADGTFDCASGGSAGRVTSDATPCKYAALNGYPTTGLTANESNLVTVSFPPSVPNVTPAPPGLAPSPFIRVDVLDRVKVFFSPLITGQKTQDVRASATCALVLASAPIPIIVQNPTCQHAFQISGSGTLTVVGGPSKSVQVNSNNSCASAGTNSSSTCGSSGGGGGGATVDLSHGGPNFSGSNFGTFGGPSTASFNLTAGAGRWSQPSAPIADPYARTPAPDQPTTNGGVTKVGYHDPVHNCPDPAGCLAYTPGFYNKPIVVQGETAVFVPGIYYIKPTAWNQDFAGAASIPGRGNKSAQGGGFCGSAGSGCTSGGTGQCRADFLLDSGGIARLSAATGDGSKGVMFYMSGTNGNYGGAVSTSNSGSRTIDAVPSTSLTCDGTAPDANLGVPNNLQGNILLGQCTGGGSYIGSPSTDTAGVNRGLLFFMDRANNDQNGQTNMQGGGGLAIAGTIYEHNCTPTAGNSTTPPCNDFPTNYNAFVQLQGTPGSGTYLLGEIITDQLNIAGNGSIGMQLNPNAVLQILKVQLVR